LDAANAGRFAPADIEIDRDRWIRVRWADGVETRTELAELRKACPCATCRADREQRQRNPLHVLARAPVGREDVTIAEGELVGRYALRLRWKDGHETGIYDFRTLREIADAAARTAGASPT
jgi:DUF971 family protein